MKKINILMAILLMFILNFSSLQTKAQVGVSVSFQSFYDNLSPYGNWISYPQYGYVWQPNVGRGFHPYRTSGHWVWSDEYQWIWVSDYEWGWAPFHYGRWHYDAYYGWIWLPDYVWAPAWVVWRGGGNYYGWAPLDFGISISFGFGNYSPAHNYWSFVPRQYVASPTIYNYYVNTQQNTTIINNTTVINNYRSTGGPTRDVFVNGPARTEVQKYTTQNITPVKLSETSKPGRTRATNNQVNIYKPKVSATDKGSARPSKVVTTAKTNKTTEPQKSQPQKTQPVKTQPQKSQPQKTQPVKTQPQKSQPQKTQPVKTQPQQSQPQKTQPVKTQPQQSQPQKTQPVKTEPQKNQPQKKKNG